MSLTRRGFLSALAVGWAARHAERLFAAHYLIAGAPRPAPSRSLAGPHRPAPLAAQTLTPLPRGRLMRTVPLGRFNGRAAPPLGTLLGTGLDARQFTDLSALTPETLLTPNDRFFVRTALPPGTTLPGRWTIGLGGRVRLPVDLSVDALAPLVRDVGTHLIECAGNSDPANFGLMSAAAWSGVPVGALLDRVAPLSGTSLIRITGFDADGRASRSSVPGASWIFSRDDLEKTGAFLATRMNGVQLPPDHGFPVRLLVPNWYGCACIKWVSRLDFVADDEPPTSQMREFAVRTHQDGLPTIARDFQPPVIDLAAAPVRVEQWAVDGRIVYRVVGVRWGGLKPTRALTIRFRHDQPFVQVDNCPDPVETRTWSMWSHLWRPESPGRYQIVLSVSDRTIRARRLDLFFYTREVQVDEV